MDGTVTNATEEYVVFDKDVIMVQKLLTIITLIFVPFILISNTLVFWATMLCSHFHTPVNVLLFSLCIADLSMGLFCIPMFILSNVESTKYVIFGSKNLCLLRFASNWVSAIGSLINLLFISIDRYIALTRPKKYKTLITVKSTIRVVIIMWMFILTVAFLPIMGWNNYNPQVNIDIRCRYAVVLPAYYRMYFGNVAVYFCVGIPFILHVYVCIKIYKNIRLLNQQYRDMTEETVRVFKDSISTITITLMLMFLFILLWLPYLLLMPFKYLRLFPEKELYIIGCISQLLYFTNAVVNAPIYAIARRDYMHTYMLMLRTPPWMWKKRLRQLVKRKLFLFVDNSSDQPVTRRLTTTYVSLTDKEATEVRMSRLKSPLTALRSHFPEASVHSETCL